jgi:hypothetical protein
MRVGAMPAGAVWLVLGAAVGGFDTETAQEQPAAQSFLPALLAKRTLHRRAVEAVIWGIPYFASKAPTGAGRPLDSNDPRQGLVHLFPYLRPRGGGG